MKTKTLILFAIVIIAALLLCNLIQSPMKIVSYDDYIIHPNDTLWAIAKGRYGEEIDVRKVIYDIKQCNNIDANIVVGQTIKLPVYE